MLPAVAPERRALVAELGFELFRKSSLEPNEPDSPKTDSAAIQVRERIARLSGVDVDDIKAPSSHEEAEAVAISERLTMFARQRAATTYLVDPVIPGCGIIETATGDLLIRRARYSVDDDLDPPETYEQLLYEVKTVARPFRALDIRQLITYAALMAAADEAPVTVGVVNPRLGTFIESPIDRLAEDIAGVPANELLQRVIFDISAAGISL